MSDTIDDFKFMKRVRDAERKLFGVQCPRCIERQPKRFPTTLMPGRRCKVDGYVDPREADEQAQFQAACALASMHA